MTVDGAPLQFEEAVTAVVSALFAVLRFSDAWEYILFLDSVPEKDPQGLRKAPSRWGAVFTRTAGVSGVVDEGNAFYYKLIALLEAMAMQLGRPGLQRLRQKTSVAKIQERAGDYLEAVLGRPALQRHVAMGGRDTGYADWTAESAAQWEVSLGHTDPAERAAGRVLQLVAAVQDLETVMRDTLRPGTWTCEELIEVVFMSENCSLLGRLREAVSPDAAARIRLGDPGAPARRRRSAAGLLKQEQRRRRLWGARAQLTVSSGSGAGASAGASSSSGAAPSPPPPPGLGA